MRVSLILVLALFNGSAHADYYSHVHEADEVAGEAKTLHDAGKIPDWLYYQAQNLPDAVAASDGGHMEDVERIRYLIHLSPSCAEYESMSGEEARYLSQVPASYERVLGGEIEDMWRSCQFNAPIDDRMVDKCVNLGRNGMTFVHANVQSCKKLPSCLADFYKSKASDPVSQATISSEMQLFQKEHANAEHNCELLGDALDKAAKAKKAEGDRKIAALKGKIRDAWKADHLFEFQQFLARSRLPRYVNELNDARKSSAKALAK